MRLFLQEYEWALSSAWSGKPGDFFPPELTNVSNLGHPLFQRIAVPNVVLNFGASPNEENHRVPIDADHFHCAVIDIVSTEETKLVTVEAGPRADGKAAPKKPPPRLAGGLSKTIYGHTAQNDLSLWGSEYVRILYELHHQELLDLLWGPDKEPHYLWIELLFQFGPYSCEPSHEPSGMLNSARLIPATSFETDSPYLRRLRFDMQCEPRLESLDTKLKDAEFPAIAVLTRDSEVLDPLAVAEIFVRQLAQPSRKLGSNVGAVSATKAAAAFVTIEKPLLYEICSTGWRAKPVPAPSSMATPTPPPNLSATPTPAAGSVPSLIAAPPGTPLWDNVHIAPGKRVDIDWVPPLPSAPGAYYALHCHWRWGAMLTDFWYLYNNSGWRALFDLLVPGAPGLGVTTYVQFMDSFFRTLHPDGRDAQYRGLAITANAGGPLFDPNLPHQTVQFAIAKSEHAKLAKDVQFEFVRDFGPGANVEPDQIDGGEMLSWWLSFAVERPRPADPPASGADRFGGTLFAHGMHFAHNLYEPRAIFGASGSLSSVSAGRAAYEPSEVPRAWER